ncbi:MAG TPA: DNA primase, partial [Solirubrobacteraceae bacterium]|nr:DNA primase [Solirubrobacteraceae bacterium]
MSRYTGDSRDRVFDAIDMVALVGRRVDLRRAGVNSYFGNCPFHDERTGSFHVSPDEKLYHCFGCQASGDAFKFVMETEGVGFVEALESLADTFGVALETEDEDPAAAARRQRRARLYSLTSRACVYYSRYLWEAREALQARDYLLGRGFTEEVLREFRVGYAPSAWDRLLVASRRAGFADEELLLAGLAQRSHSSPGAIFDRFRRRIMFPAVDARSNVRGFGARAMGPDQKPKYLNTSDGELYHKREQLFGIDLARSAAARAGRMILVEGYTDVMALHQAGMRNAVGIMGTSLTTEQVDALAKTVPTLELCLDADRAGQDAMLRAARLASGRRLELRVVKLPQGADPGDLIQRDGPEALRALVEASEPFVVFQVERIIERHDRWSAEQKDPAIAELVPLLGDVPRGALLDQLMQRISGRLELDSSQATALYGSISQAGRPAPSSPANGSADGHATPGVRLDRTIHNEQAFLALCVALPADGARALAQRDPEQLLTSEVLRRAARHLSGRLETPMVDLPPEDEELARAVAELVRRSGSSVEISADRLEHARLLLELSRVERAIKRARVDRASDDTRADVTGLAREREAIRAEMRDVLSRIERTV